MPFFHSDPRVTAAKERVRHARVALGQADVDRARAKADLREAKLDLKNTRIYVRESKRAKAHGRARPIRVARADSSTERFEGTYYTGGR